MDRLNPATAWLAALTDAIGADAVITDLAERELLSQDVFSSGITVEAIVRPAGVEQVGLAMRVLNQAGVAVHPRGGGLSYTEGFLAQRSPAVVMDLSRLNGLVELNVEDRYVVVETGMTWAALDALLAPHQLRTPYWGPLSGLRSTVGGALSQGSVFLGSGLHGAVGDSVLGLDVVTADGGLLVTGAGGARGTPPFMRWYGPDLTGAFIGDAGSLGLKVRASLRLINRPRELACLSYEFEQVGDVLAAMSEVSRQELAAECFAFDPYLVNLRLQRSSLMSDAKTLAGVVKQSGLLAGARLVAAGRGFVGAGKWTVHATLEAADAAELRRRSTAAQAVLGRAGKEIERSIPQALRGAPFVPPNSILGPRGERWVPVHGVFAHSRAAAGYAAGVAALAPHAAAMAEHRIEVGRLVTSVAAQGLLIEPVFLWPDAHTAYHRAVVEPAYRERAGEPPAQPAATVLMARIKRDLADAMRAAGAVHFQLGRFYDWRDGRNAAMLRAFDALKSALDPHGVVNPGVLR